MKILWVIDALALAGAVLLTYFLVADGLKVGRQNGTSMQDAFASYLVIDLVTGETREGASIPEGGWTTADKVDRLVLREIAHGSFDMGEARKPKSLIAEASPKHRVTLTKDYFIGVFEVTQGQWRHVMGSEGGALAKSAHGELPVDKTTREMARRFLAALGKRYPAYAFSLPTEAEWEYACRAGNSSQKADAWQKSNADGSSHPVGLRRPNAWGLHDVCGNVWEWCGDVAYAYGDAPETDPVHLAKPGTHPLFVARGGSWRNGADVCTPTHRASFDADIDIIPIGLRVVCRPRNR